MDNIRHRMPIDVWRNPHTWYITTIMMVCTIFYYLGTIIELIGWPKPQWGDLYAVHDLHRLLFFIPVLYAAYIFRVRGAIVTALISMLIFFYRAMFISPYPESLLRPIVFVIILGGVGILVSKLFDNITERKRAEEQRERLLSEISELALIQEMKRDMLDTIMENTGAQLAYLDPDFNFIRVNSAYAKGSDHAIDELIGRNHFDLFPNKENQAIFEKVRDTGKSVEFHDKPFEYKDQPWRGITYWDWTLVPVRDASGRVQGLVLSLVDTTERRRAEEELKSSRDYLNRLMDSMWDAVFSVKMPERVIEWANDSFRLTGYEPEECIGKTTQFLYPDERGFFNFGDKLKSAIAGGEDVLHTELLLKRKNDEVFPAEITTTFFKEKGKVVRVTSIVRDVTEHKRAEDMLKESEEKLRLTFESATDGMIVTDLNGNLMRVNEAAVHMHGYDSKEELIGRSCFEFLAVKDRARAMENMKRVLEVGHLEKVDHRVLRKDGSEFDAEISVAVLQGASGNPAGFVVIIRDITERKKLNQLKDDFISVSSPTNCAVP